MKNSVYLRCVDYGSEVNREQESGVTVGVL